jgi:hypothetical protein
MKTHLLDSSEPITEGRTQTAICGTEVKDAAFVRDGETTFIGQPVEDLIVMATCFRCRYTALKSANLLKKYLYVLVAGEELKERQREREAAV